MIPKRRMFRNDSTADNGSSGSLAMVSLSQCQFPHHERTLSSNLPGDYYLETSMAIRSVNTHRGCGSIKGEKRTAGDRDNADLTKDSGRIDPPIQYPSQRNLSQRAKEYAGYSNTPGK